MFKDKDLTDSHDAKSGPQNPKIRVSQPDSGKNYSYPDEKIGVSGNGLDFIGESETTRDGFRSKSIKPGNFGSSELSCLDLSENVENPSEKVGIFDKGVDFLRESGKDRDGFQSIPGESGCQELTLSYLCDSLKPLKGKGLIVENLGHEEKWVERDFLQLSDSKGGSSKRDPEETQGEGDCSKKQRLETLKLSLAPPDVSLSLTASNAAPNCEGTVQLKPTRSVQSLALSNNNTHMTCSNDFTGASLSYSYSHPFSHNPSCSLTQNSTEYYEHSVGSRRRETDQIWNGGEGTNGSVHSCFRPIGDGIGFSNHGNGVGYALMNRGRPLNRESSNSLYRATGSDSSSFFPSELPAKPKTETMYSIDSNGRPVDHLGGLDGLEDRRARKTSSAERIVRDIITEPIPVMSHLFQEFPAETIESAKEYVKSLTAAPERKDKLVELQALLERKPEPTKETLSKAHKAQLEILVALKFGLNEFVLGKVCLETHELAEVFLYMRCQNVNCKSWLPVDDCDCKICSTKKGFCSHCMCPVCYKYDCANNTCSWVGCDACSHWCHAACGIEKNCIRPGPSKGSSGMSEMQFYCLGCGHASEMFGFVKDVFVYCAKDWGLQTLIKELDCVRRIFKGSEDLKGKELYLKAAEMITRLERRVMSPLDACNFIIWFFTNKETTSEFPATALAAREPTGRQGGLLNDAVTFSSPNVPSKSSTHTINPSLLQDLLPYDVRHRTPKPALVSEHRFEHDFSRKLSKKEGLDNLESIVHIKEVEARMFQNRADEAKKEVVAYRELVLAKTKKLEEEYAEKLATLCLQEAEEKRRKKLEELKIIESSHSDYFNMKKRMQDEIRGLLERMEATKQQLM